MELLCQGSVTRHQESKNMTNQRSGLLDKKPRILGGEANTDVAIPLTQEGGNIIRHGSGHPDKKPSILDGEANTDVAIPLIQVTNTNEEDNYRVRHCKHQLHNALPPNFSDETPSCIEQDSIDVVEYDANDTSINVVEYPANNTNSEDITNITTSDDTPYLI